MCERQEMTMEDIKAYLEWGKRCNEVAEEQYKREREFQQVRP